MSPEAVLQRCTVHIAREVELWITRKPKSDAARELLELVRLLGRIETHQEAQICMRVFVEWYRKYEAFINENTTDELIGRWWYTHKMLTEVPRISAEHCPKCLLIPAMRMSPNPRTPSRHFSDT